MCGARPGACRADRRRAHPHRPVILGVVVAAQAMEGNLLQPFIRSRAVSLRPATVMMSVAAGAGIAGVLGALLAVPLAAAGVGIVEELRGRPGPNPRTKVRTVGEAGERGAGSAAESTPEGSGQLTQVSGCRRYCQSCRQLRHPGAASCWYGRPAGLVEAGREGAGEVGEARRTPCPTTADTGGHRAGQRRHLADRRGDNPERLSSEASFAALCGVSPSSTPPAGGARVGSITVATGRRTPLCTASCSPGWATTSVAGRAASNDSMRVIVQTAVVGLLVQLGHTVTDMPDGGGVVVLAEAALPRGDTGS